MLDIASRRLRNQPFVGATTAVTCPGGATFMDGAFGRASSPNRMLKSVLLAVPGHRLLTIGQWSSTQDRQVWAQLQEPQGKASPGLEPWLAPLLDQLTAVVEATWFERPAAK